MPEMRLHHHPHHALLGDQPLTISDPSIDDGSDGDEIPSRPPRRAVVVETIRAQVTQPPTPPKFLTPAAGPTLLNVEPTPVTVTVPVQVSVALPEVLAAIAALQGTLTATRQDLTDLRAEIRSRTLSGRLRRAWAWIRRTVRF